MAHHKRAARDRRAADKRIVTRHSQGAGAIFDKRTGS